VNPEAWTGVLYSLGPTVLVGLLFWFIMRAIIRADRTERKAYAQIEAEERAKLEARK
jgi:flagellar biosynthesis/type III secretory pathway M-ring protein FliF/YscJ